MNRIFVRPLKILAGVIIAFLIVFIFLYIFIQTDAFNKWALEFTLEKVNASWQEKDNRITADSLTGNILTGIILHKGAILTKGDSLLRFDHLDIKYDIWGLLKQEIRLEHVILNSPEINLAKVRNGEDIAWNFTNLFSSSDEKDTSVTEFDWDITVEKLKIENGSMKFFGNVNDTIPVWKRAFSKLDSFDITSLYVKNFELELSTDYFKDRKNISLKNLSFNTNSDFNIKRLMFEAFINIKDSVTDLSGFELITNRSDVKIGKLKMNRFNPFDSIVYDEFGKKDIAADINIKKFNFDDLKFFIPSLEILDSVVALSLVAEGKYGDLIVKDLKVNLPNSIINMKGNVKNLQEPDSLYFDVVLPGLSIDPRDIRLVYTAPLIPDYSNLGIVSGDLNYKGTLSNFYSEYNISSGAGFADGSIDLNTDYETYRGFINTRNINLGKILKDNSLNSNINMNAYFSGNKFDMNSMAASLIYDIQNSNFAGYDIKRSSGKLKTAGLNILLNIRHLSSMGNAVVNGSINISNMNNPVYSLKGKVNNLDVSKFTKKREDKSNLNFSFDVRGRGSDINNINGRYNFNVGDSYYSTYKIPQTPVNVEINNSGKQSKVKVFTDMLDFNADGSFDLPTVIKVLQNNIATVSDAITKQMTPDSLLTIESSTGIITNNFSDFSLQYDLSVKDTIKLQQILNPFGISFSGNVKGNASNSLNGFSSDVTLDIINFIYNDTSIILKNVKSGFRYNNNYTLANGDNLFSSYDFDLKTTGDKIIYENNKIDSAKIDMVLNNSILNMNVKGKQDTTNSLVLNGRLNILGNKISADIDSVFVIYNEYNLSNNKNWMLDYYPDGRINFQQFEVKSKELLASISGEYAINGNSDVKIEAANFNPGQVFEILNYKKTDYPLEGNMDLLINYKGDVENPFLNLKITSDDLKYNDSKIGTIDASLEYKDEIAMADVSLENENKKGNLKIVGNMPYKNPLSSDTLSSNEFSNSPVDIKLSAKNFELEYFTKLIPDLPDISGLMNGEITTGGVVSAPELEGNLKVTGGSAFFDLTGMNYKYNVSLSTADSKLNVEKISLSNSDESRHLDIFGNVDFTGMKLNRIELSTSGDMVLLDGTAQRNTLGVEGFVLGGVAGDPIKITGDLNKLDITGQFLIKEATISSLPTSGSGYNLEDDNFIYVSASPDSAGFIKDSLFLENPEDIYKMNPFDKNKYIIAESKDSVSILNLDLNVKTEKNIYVSIDFKNLTRDRLFGEITADLNIKSAGKDINAFGYVNVLKDSYYRFYRNFKINNSNITFNGLITKPILDIQAVYEGVKTTEQFGNTLNFPVEVKLTLKGQIDSPAVNITLSEDGSVVSGNDAQADAITYLLFGKYKSELSTSERKTMASSVGTTVGSLYITSFISQTVREILPFLVDAEFNYTDGNVQNTDVEVTSEFGDLSVKVGGKLLKEIKNFEFTVDYPLNKLLNLKLPETLIIEISREVSSLGGSANTQDAYTTGIKIAYKIKF